MEINWVEVIQKYQAGEKISVIMLDHGIKSPGQLYNGLHKHHVVSRGKGFKIGLSHHINYGVRVWGADFKISPIICDKCGKTLVAYRDSVTVECTALLRNAKDMYYTLQALEKTQDVKIWCQECRPK